VSCACSSLDALIGYRDIYAFPIGIVQPRIGRVGVPAKRYAGKKFSSKFAPRFAGDRTASLQRAQHSNNGQIKDGYTEAGGDS
jgi:hypothetical protein